jgi:Tfp pilus assembly protein PilV
MIELCVAVAMLAAALSVVVTMLGAVARQRRSAELHARALEEADNLLERLTAEPWDEITPERVTELGFAAKVADALPEGKLRIDMTSPGDAPATKRIDLAIGWRAAIGQSIHRVYLTTWVEQKGAP